MRKVDEYGFPRTKAKGSKVVKGKKIGNYFGRVAARSSGSFNIKTKESTVQGISYKNCQLIQRADGYSYQKIPLPPLPPLPEGSGGSGRHLR